MNGINSANPCQQWPGFFLVKCSNALAEGTEFVIGIETTSVSARLK